MEQCKLSRLPCLARVGHGSCTLTGSASERAKGWGAVKARSGHLAQYHYAMLLARSGLEEGGRANATAGSRA